MSDGGAVRFADNLIKRFPDPDDYPFRSWCYAQGFYLWGFLKLYDRTGDVKYLDYVKDYGDKHVREDGTVPAFTGDSLDDIMAGSQIAQSKV